VSSSRGVRLLFRARLRRIRPFPFSDPARLRSPERSRESGPPLLGFLLPSKRLYVGCPCSPAQPLGHPGRRRLPHLRRSRPQGSCPSRRFKLRTRHDTSPCGARRLPWRPDASRPYYMPLASLWSCPTELSLPEEPFLLSQAVASLRVRFRLPPARPDRALSRSLSASRQLFASDPPGGESRRMSRDDVFPRSLGLSALHAFTWSPDPPFSPSRARRLAAGTPASKLCSPRESVRLRPLALARAKSPRRCSPGHFPSRACSIHDSGFGLSRRPTLPGFMPRPRLPPRTQPSRLDSETRAPTPGF
jgi:hypothetical protein